MPSSPCCRGEGTVPRPRTSGGRRRSHRAMLLQIQRRTDLPSLNRGRRSDCRSVLRPRRRLGRLCTGLSPDAGRPSRSRWRHGRPLSPISRAQPVRPTTARLPMEPAVAGRCWACGRRARGICCGSSGAQRVELGCPGQPMCLPRTPGRRRWGPIRREMPDRFARGPVVQPRASATASRSETEAPRKRTCSCPARHSERETPIRCGAGS